MSKINYPRVLSLIATMVDNNGELRELFEKLDNVLQQEEDQQQSNQSKFTVMIPFTSLKTPYAYFLKSCIRICTICELS